MILHFVRHAEAIEATMSLPDEWRSLTKKGRATTSKMRSIIFKNGPKPGIIITSPLVRAVQTAEILFKKIHKESEIVISEHLLPGTHINKFIKYIQSYDKDSCVVIVGHEPMLSMIVSKLLDKPSDSVKIKKSACVTLAFMPNKKIKAKFLGYLMPRKKRILSFNKAFL